MAGMFKVISQRQSIELRGDGQFMDVMEVTAETIPGGHTFTERIPIRDYVPEHVSQLLSERAQALIDVDNL